MCRRRRSAKKGSRLWAEKDWPRRPRSEGYVVLAQSCPHSSLQEPPTNSARQRPRGFRTFPYYITQELRSVFRVALQSHSSFLIIAFDSVWCRELPTALIAHPVLKLVRLGELPDTREFDHVWPIPILFSVFKSVSKSVSKPVSKSASKVAPLEVLKAAIEEHPMLTWKAWPQSMPDTNNYHSIPIHGDATICYDAQIQTYAQLFTYNHLVHHEMFMTCPILPVRMAWRTWLTRLLLP